MNGSCIIFAFSVTMLSWKRIGRSLRHVTLIISAAFSAIIMTTALLLAETALVWQTHPPPGAWIRRTHWAVGPPRRSCPLRHPFWRYPPGCSRTRCSVGPCIPRSRPSVGARHYKRGTVRRADGCRTRGEGRSRPNPTQT